LLQNDEPVTAIKMCACHSELKTATRRVQINSDYITSRPVSPVRVKTFEGQTSIVDESQRMIMVRIQCHLIDHKLLTGRTRTTLVGQDLQQTYSIARGVTIHTDLSSNCISNGPFSIQTVSMGPIPCASRAVSFKGFIWQDGTYICCHLFSY
jgi:hypothetical protein